jgi:hypothetical protein
MKLQDLVPIIRRLPLNIYNCRRILIRSERYWQSKVWTSLKPSWKIYWQSNRYNESKRIRCFVTVCVSVGDSEMGIVKVVPHYLPFTNKIMVPTVGLQTYMILFMMLLLSDVSGNSILMSLLHDR